MKILILNIPCFPVYPTPRLIHTIDTACHVGDLEITGYFGPKTYAAVKAFQLKYFENVLTPWIPYGLSNASTATGYVYKTTLRQINNLNCTELDLPIPQLP